jgi:hypothetical protein
MRASALAVLVLVGCGGGVEPLRGSLTDQTDLEYTRSTLEVREGSLALRFLKARGDQEDTLIKIGVNTAGLTLAPGLTIDLAEALPSGGQRGKVTRNVYMDATTELPALLRGTLKLGSDVKGAKIVSGEVSVTFVQGNVMGSGRAVFGPFAAEVTR